MADLIYVKSTLPDNRVALAEEHPDHPFDKDAGKNEVFVYGDKAFQVGRTQAVSQRLADGTLVETTAKGSEKADQAAATDQQPADSGAKK